MKRAAITVFVVLAMGGAAFAQQDQTPTLDALEVTGVKSQTPITNKEYEALSKTDWFVPHYSAEQISSFICNTRRGGMGQAGLNNATLALRATEEFEATKDKVRQGQATLEDLILANNRRQDKVGDMLRRTRSEAAAAAMSARTGRIMFKNGPPGFNNQDRYRLEVTPQSSGDMWIDKYSYKIEPRKTGLALIVTVEIVNKGAKSGTPPEIAIATLDRAKYVLADESYKMDGVLQAGQRGRGVYVFENMPYYTYDISVHFGGSEFPRNSRNCTIMEKFRDVAGKTLASDSDDAQLALNAASRGARNEVLSVENLLIDAQRDASGLAFVVSATLRNHSPAGMDIPNSTLRLLDARGEPVGKAQLALSSLKIDGNTTQTYAFKVRSFAPTTPGRDPVANMVEAELLLGVVD